MRRERLRTCQVGPGHGGNQTLLISAMIKLGNAEKRLQEFTAEGMKVAHVTLDPELMRIFQYHMSLGE